MTVWYNIAPLRNIPVTVIDVYWEYLEVKDEKTV